MAACPHILYYHQRVKSLLYTGYRTIPPAEIVEVLDHSPIVAYPCMSLVTQFVEPLIGAQHHCG